MAVDPVTAVREALKGGPFNVEAVDTLSYDRAAALAVREELLPLILQLVDENPQAAQKIPEGVINNLFFDNTLDEMLQITNMGADHLQSALIRPLLLAQLANKAMPAPADQKNRSVAGSETAEVLVREAFQLLADPYLDTASVAALDRLAEKLPQAALAYIPFARLHSGSEELNSRLMEANKKLLKRKVVPPVKYLLWVPLASEDADLLLAALQTDYVADLVPFFTAQPSIQSEVHAAVYELCKRYRNSMLDNTIERVLVAVAQYVEPLFLELDAQFLLIRADKPSLISQISPGYVVRNHPEIIEQLELNNANLYAVANLMQDFRGLQLLPLTSSRIASLPGPSQLLLAAAATNTQQGAEYFDSRFHDILHNAYNIQESENTRELKATLRANLNQWGIRIRKQPGVQLAS